MGHARALLALETPEQVKSAREEIVKGHLTVRAAETLVKRMKANRPAKQPKSLDPHFADLVERLKRHFRARVAIRQSGRGGKVEITFSNADDLSRILDIINC
jgi:ParB family chromosome partitioning protein